MGWTAAQLLVKRIQAPDQPYPEEVWFEPELIIRESTTAIHAAVPPKSRKEKR
jgi:DNA-binding LacI/PurR family transcriptional regulator